MEFSINEEVDKEVCQIVDAESVAEVPADWSSRVDGEGERDERQNKDNKKTCSDFHRLHVSRFAHVLPENNISLQDNFLFQECAQRTRGF